MKTLFYLHGAGATPVSFSALASKLPEHIARYLSYQIDEPAADITARVLAELRSLDAPVSLIGHSLGGIIATLASAAPQVDQIATLNAPFGGVRVLDFIGFFRREPFFTDLRSHGPFLTAARATVTRKPHLAIVGTYGLPTSSEPNDGVVTVASQTAKPDIIYHLTNLNHFEVLLADAVAEELSRFLFPK
jgi:pimeloyl-ACP methyl ester carboxylesterase